MIEDPTPNPDRDLFLLGQAQLHALQAIRHDVHTLRQIVVFWTVVYIVGAVVAVAVLSQKS